MKKLVSLFVILSIALSCAAQTVALQPLPLEKRRAEVEPSAIPYEQRDQWIFYQSKDRGWRWRRVSSNGRIVGSSSESYKRLRDCKANATRNGWIQNNRTITLPH